MDEPGLGQADLSSAVNEADTGDPNLWLKGDPRPPPRTRTQQILQMGAAEVGLEEAGEQGRKRSRRPPVTARLAGVCSAAGNGSRNRPRADRHVLLSRPEGPAARPHPESTQASALLGPL